MRIERTVLLIDDDKEDVEMLEQALKLADGNHRIIEAKDGVEGMEKLVALMDQGILPCLIVLDINMPRMDGRQTFVSIKSDKMLSTVPVVIFSTSTSSLDRSFFEKHHTAYFIKPINFAELAKTAAKMMHQCSHEPGENM